jgi:hypothetical protein
LGCAVQCRRSGGALGRRFSGKLGLMLETAVDRFVSIAKPHEIKF